MLNPIFYTIAAPECLPKLLQTCYNVAINKLMNLLKIRPKKSVDTTRKSSDSCDYRTSSGLNQNEFNSSQITIRLHSLERKLSDGQAKDFTKDFTRLDCNNNENLV